MRLIEAKELTTDQDLAQTLMSGGSRDPYVIFALNEENAKGPKEGAIGLGRAVDRARSSTVWSKSVADQAKEGLQARFTSNTTPYAHAMHAPRTCLARAMHAPCTARGRGSSTRRSRPQRAVPRGQRPSS